MKNYNSPEYKRSRAAYTSQCTIEYFVSLLVTDAFLAKLLSAVGISDALVGIISSFITLAFVIQLLSIFLLKLRVSTKKLVISLDTISIFFFMLLYFVPFLSEDKAVRTVLIVASVLLAYAGKYLILSICYKWANSYVEPTKRASFSAVKEIISLFSGMIFTMAVGFVIDRYESLGNLNGAFLFIACSILILNICNFICLSMIKKESVEESEEEKVSFGDVLSNTLKNKSFRNIIVLTVLWDTARYFTVGFIGVFKTNDLLMSVFLIQLVNTLACFARMLISKPFGRYSDKHSYAKGFKLGLWLAAGGFFINIFTARSTWFLIIAYTVLYNCSMAGTNQNSFNISYNYVASKYISHAMAIKNSIGGICGFAASVAGGRILSLIQQNGNMLFGISVYGQQLLSGISFIIVIVAILFTQNVIEKQEITVQ